ncbi:MAG: hypothetical protein FJY65_02885 [Calditrichaeota bacterium]|nr:hypothetical protein [Calditrichota bacterium]
MTHKEEEQNSSSRCPAAETLGAGCLLPSYVVIDVETTGLDPFACEIIELGAVLFQGGKPTARYSQLVKPSVRSLPREIVQLTGIDDHDLLRAPRLDSVADEFVDFIGQHPLVGHHIEFDLSFLSATSALAHHFQRSRTVPISHDSALLARFIYPCLHSYGLAHLAALFRTLTRPCHRAADDAAATGELFAILLEKLSQVHRTQLSQARRLVEGTSSPLANTLRDIIEIFKDTLEPKPSFHPDPFWSSNSGRDNVFIFDRAKKSTDDVDIEPIQDIFHDKARFSSIIPNYELRREQIDMAAEIVEALKSGQIIVVEAGTGVGKSLAYLVPALLSGKKTIVSTHTKNLQDQLFYTEIPRLGAIAGRPFKAALLKGRRNYLCWTKWRNLCAEPERYSFAVRERAALLVRWVDATLTGDLSEITAVRGDNGDGEMVLRLIASEPGYCGGRGCGHGGRECPLTRIHRTAVISDIVVANHSLLLADLLNAAGLLADFHCVVFDEAHHLEDAATDQFSTDCVSYLMRSALERIGRLCRRNGELWTMLAAQPLNDKYVALCERLSTLANDTQSEVDRFFTTLRMLFPVPESNNSYPIPYKYKPKDRLHSTLAATGGSLKDTLIEILSGLDYIIESFSDVDEGHSLPPALQQEITAAVEEYREIALMFNLSLKMDDENRIYWVEVPVEDKEPLHLKTAPLELNKLLSDALFGRLEASVLTSATLATARGRGAFAHLISRLGLDLLPGERILTAQFGSPFDFERNCIVCCPTFSPSPVDNTSEALKFAAEFLTVCAVELQRSTLALFTSYQALRSVEKTLNRTLLGTGVEIFVQRGRSDRDRLVRRFKQTKGSLLLGTDSLWEGIDLPGAALEIVVIVKLPFDVPTDPVISARADLLRQAGRNPFGEYQLPLAVLRTRQGAGRLIRSAADRGAIVILDPRVVVKSYGATIRSALPGRIIMPKSKDDMIKQIGGFFNE